MKSIITMASFLGIKGLKIEADNTQGNLIQDSNTPIEGTQAQTDSSLAPDDYQEDTIDTTSKKPEDNIYNSTLPRDPGNITDTFRTIQELVDSHPSHFNTSPLAQFLVAFAKQTVDEQELSGSTTPSPEGV